MASEEADGAPDPTVANYITMAIVAAAVALIFAGSYVHREIPELVDGLLYEGGDYEEYKLVRPQPFDMGSGSNDAQPVRTVTLTQPFMIGTREVTNALYQDYLAGTGARYGPAEPFREENLPTWPVVNVSYNDATRFATWYSGVMKATYRLPTEAEWEWLARQSEAALDDPCSLINFRGGAPYFPASSVTNYLVTEDFTSNVRCGSESAVLVGVDEIDEDTFGLYHLFGNAAEWVQDCYAPNYENAPDDGSAHEVSSCRVFVVRGGSWLSSLSTITPTFRGAESSDYRDFHIGFRLVREVDWLDAFALERPGTNWNVILPGVAYGLYTLAGLLVVGVVVFRRRRQR